MDRLQYKKNIQTDKYKMMAIKVNGKYEVFINGIKIDRFYLLSLAAKAKTQKEAWDYMNLASTLFHALNDDVFNTLYTSVACELTVWKGKKDEFYYQGLLKSNYSKIREGKIVDRINYNHHIPDAWVLKNNEYIPVEVKLNNFNNKALQQLKRYMDFYNCNKGIASARELTVKLPSNIEFIPFSELEQFE